MNGLQKDRWLILASTVFVIFIGSVSSSIQCSNYYYADRCEIQNLNINSSEIASLKFPVQENFFLSNVIVDYASPQLMAKMQWVSTITISGGDIGKIYLKPDLQKLSASSSNTVELVIDSEKNENLSDLTITSNKLKSLPANVGQLKALTVLHLSSNEIEYANFCDLSELNKLTDISMAGNRIYAVTCTEQLKLERLKNFDLSRNYLKEIDFTNWIMPRLVTLNINSNHLQYLTGLDETTFPSLQQFLAGDNSWDCRWRDRFAPLWSSITSKHMGYNPMVCSKQTQLSLSVYRRLNLSDGHGLQLTLDNQEQLEEQISNILGDAIKQAYRIDALTETVESQAKTINALSEKLLDGEVTIESMMDYMRNLAKKIEQMQESSRLLSNGSTSMTVPKGLTAKLIQEISNVIKMNLKEEESDS